MDFFADSFNAAWSSVRRLWIPTGEEELHAAERALFDTHVSSSVSFEKVPIGDGQHLNHVHVRADAQQPAAQTTPLVMLHGYAAAAGCFALNLDDLAPSHDGVFAVDLLGHGTSSRPDYKATNTREAEEFFVQSLEAWREAKQLDKITLLGHSFGGYMSAAYALKHPERVERLILVSPAGVPRQTEEDMKRFDTAPLGIRMLIGGVRRLWDMGATPQGLVRAMGPFGKGLVDKYTQARYRQSRGNLDRETFSTYAYHTAAARGSGEHALRHVLAPGAFAHDPLCDRLHGLPMPVSFIYGERDWMDPNAAAEVVRRGAAPPATQVLVVPDAGHMVMLDNPDVFANAVRRATETHEHVDAPQSIDDGVHRLA